MCTQHCTVRKQIGPEIVIGDGRDPFSNGRGGAHVRIRELGHISNERSFTDLSFGILTSSLTHSWAPPRPSEKGYRSPKCVVGD